MLINNDNFLIKEIPLFNPITQKFERLDFWRREKRRIIEGYWYGGKWCPPELYYYVNYHTIVFEDGANQALGRPFLRDIDWDQAYIYTEACGFSGFELDTEYTCDRKYGPERETSIKYGRITEAEANSKKYINARDYLRKNHGKNLGKAMYLNQSKNILELASRGYGKSYGASGRITHNFLTDGARDYDLYLANRAANRPFRSETVVGAIDAKYSGDLLDKVKIAMEYLPGAVSINNGRNVEVFPSPLEVTFTGSLTSGEKKYTSTTAKSTLYHRTFADNPLAANGTRPNRVFIDEVGFMNNLLESLGAIEATQASAEFKRLCIYGMGTGGLTTGGAAMYAKEVFYNPEQYNCLAFEDEWENKGKICYFVPAYKALNEFKKGPNRISDEALALEYINEERALAKQASSRIKLQSTIINKPIKPSEIFLRAETTLFPVEDLNYRLAELDSKEVILNSTYKVRFNLLSGKPVMSFSDKKVIREYPAKRGMDLDAPIELFELPIKDSNSEIPFGRYLAGWDPVEVDGNDDVTQSLQSLFIMDSWTGRIVAEYSARTRIAEDYYEQVRRLLLFYNAICNYENNIKGPYGYFRNKNSLHLLAETPEILKDQNLVKGSTIGNKSIGTRTNAEVINYGLGLSVSYLDEQAYNKAEGVRNVDLIESPAWLKEMISFDRDINADRVSAFGMLMILKEDRARITDVHVNKKIKTVSSDPFWDRAFKKNPLYNNNVHFR